MKRIISTILLILLCLSLVPVMASCGDGPDRSGEWGAYYEAFLAFEKDMEDTRYLCVDYANVEEEAQKGYYDLIYHYCKENGMSVIEGSWSTLYGMRLLTEEGQFTDGYMISFTSVNWSEDRSKVQIVLSLKRNAETGNDNFGGSVTVTQKDGAWQAKRLDESAEMSDKAGAYYTVFDYFVKEAGMSGLKTILALDPDGVEEDVLSDLETLLTSYAGSQGYRFMKATWGGLKENGYVDASNVFNEGYLFAYENVTWNADGSILTVTAWMKEGDMRALGGEFTVKRQNGTWQITDVKTMMS